MRVVKSKTATAGSSVPVTAVGARLSTLSLALTAAWALMAADPAHADAPISGSVSGDYNWNSGDLTVESSGHLSGGSSGVYTAGSSLGTLSNNGYISGAFAAIENDQTLTAINNASGASLRGGDYGLYNGSGSRVGSIVNLGTIQAAANGFNGISNQGTITNLSNGGSGAIAGGDMNSGIQNSRGQISVLNNSGTIRGGDSNLGSYSHGIDNSNRSTIGTLNNNSGATIYGAYSGIYNYSGSGTSLITELNNSGLITGTVAGVYNDDRGRIATLNNLSGGTINGGLINRATINVLNNAGTIIDTSTAVTSINGGFASDGITALHAVAGTIGSLNNSGLISGINAIMIESSATISTLSNSGTISGNILNNSTRAQTILGGTGSVFGTLTGQNGSIGLIANTRSNWIFGGGNQLLNSNIDVGSNSVINSAGVLQLNKQISVSGNYQQSTTATLNIGVGSGAVAHGDSSDSGYGRLIVSGSAVIDAGSSVALKKNGSYRFANGQRYLVIQAASAGSNYNETTLRYLADGYRGDITGSTILDGSNLGLLLTLDGEIVNPATEVNARNTLDGLYKYTGTDAALMNLFNAAAALATPADANRAGSQLSPSSSTFGIVGVTDAIGKHVNGMVFNRLDGNVTNAASTGSGLSGGESMSDKAAWGQLFGGRASADERDGISGYHASYNGLLLGADAALNERWRVGGLFNYASTSVSNDGNNAGSYARVNTYGLTAYAGYQGEPWYLNMSASAMRSNIDAHRVLDFTGFSSTANSSYKGMQYTAAARIAYPINVHDMIVTPLAGLTYSSLRLDAYKETGGNGAALNVAASDTHSIKSDLGFKLERGYQTSYGVFKPMLQLLWRHEYSDTRLQSVANFAADISGATTFVTQGPSPVKDTGVLSLGATLLRSDKLSLSAAYTLEKGGGYTSQTGSLLARWRF
jgi:outer membrane autotransporter protein